MKKSIGKISSFEVKKSRSNLLRFYDVVEKYVEIVELVFLILAASLFVFMPMLYGTFDYSTAYIGKSLFVVNCMSVVVLFFIIVPCFFFSCLCDRGGKSRFTMSFIVCIFSAILYMGWIVCGNIWLFTNGSGMKPYAWGALVWFVLCLACAPRVWKALLDEI